jgi:hypothetical protein
VDEICKISAVEQWFACRRQHYQGSQLNDWKDTQRFIVRFPLLLTLTMPLDSSMRINLQITLLFDGARQGSPAPTEPAQMDEGSLQISAPRQLLPNCRETLKPPFSSFSSILSRMIGKTLTVQFH